MKIIRRIKELTPLYIKDNYWLFRDSILGWSKLHRKYNSYSNDTAFLIGVPEHGNLGDQAIAMAENSFLKENFPKTNVVCIPEEEVYTNLLCIKRFAKAHRNVTIFLHGGGNIGELYVFPELIREHCIKMLRKSKIIIFPQSIDYGSNSLAAKKARKAYELDDKLVLFIREQRSYKRAKLLFPNSNILLVPDIVLSYSFNNSEHDRDGILLCLRNDKERNKRTDNLVNQIINLLEENKCKYRWTDTHNDEIYSCKFNEQGKYVDEKLMEFSKSSVVITDRLHGMIFSLLTNTPCIALDNSTGKVSSFYYTWLTESNIVFLDSKNDLKKARQLISFPDKFGNNSVQLNLKKNFKPLIDVLCDALVCNE